MLDLTARRAVGPAQIIGALLLCALTVSSLFLSAAHSAFRDHFGVFTSGMLTPLLILLPLIITLLTALRFSSELRQRFISSQRLRSDIRRLLAARYGSAAAIGFCVAFLCSFVPYIIAFNMWPLIGDPGVDPALYRLAPEQAMDYSYHASGFGDVLRMGDMTFGLAYSTWLGFCGAVYAATGITALLLIPNRLLALAAPMLLVFGETFAAAVLGHPLLALYYSAVPFGISFNSDAQVMLPHLVLAAVVAIVAVFAVRRVPYTGRLS